jgi:hypothetical protein
MDIEKTLGKFNMVFGLTKQGHMPTIKQMLKDGKSWQEIGEKFGGTQTQHANTTNWNRNEHTKNYMGVLRPGRQ